MSVDMTGTYALSARVPTTLFTPDHAVGAALPAAFWKAETQDGKNVWFAECHQDTASAAEQLAAVLLDAHEALVVNCAPAVDCAAVIERAKTIYELRTGAGYSHQVDALGGDNGGPNWQTTLSAVAAAAIAGAGIWYNLRA